MGERTMSEPAVDRPLTEEPLLAVRGLRIAFRVDKRSTVEAVKGISFDVPRNATVALVQVSILVVGFIKAEVILSFLGFGVPAGVVSWGSMLNEAQNELLLGKWWQLAAAATAMAVLVTAFSLLADALRDALDPRVK